MELIVRHGEREEKVRLEPVDGGYRVEVGGKDYLVDVVSAGDGIRSLVIDGRQHEVSVRRRGDGRYLVADGGVDEELELMDPLTHLARQAHGAVAGSGPQKVTAYMPGQVVEVLVEEGAEVAAGQGVVVLEAMKMKNEIQAEAPGTVTRILVEAGQAVEGGDPLFEIE
jgi:biotin carboxyl carrier protein